MPDKITGQVYSLKGQKGTIICRNKQQYNFSLKDYNGSIDLEEGHLVRFEPDGKTAKNIVLSTDTTKK